MAETGQPIAGRRGRPVNRAQRAARRRQIIDAAFGCFSEQGYAGTTTAAICRAAGIGSGTLFHHFPTKSSILAAVIEHGTTETREQFARLEARVDPLEALMVWLEETIAQLAEPRLAGFVRAVSAVVGEPIVSAALAADDAAATAGLAALLDRAQRAGVARIDLSADRLAAWLLVIVDGFLGRSATHPEFGAGTEAEVLREVVLQLVARKGRR